MHIEKINENKFKCTLEKRDLDIRNLRLEELAYGTDKARQLFDEMMMKAHDQFGFTHEDAAISVEAFPISTDCLVLVISKVTNFDEVDTRFSRFSEKEDVPGDTKDEQDEGLDGMGGGVLTKEPPRMETSEKKAESEETLEEPAHTDYDDTNSGQMRVFRFQNLDVLLDAAQILHHQYNGVNDLYKDEEVGVYYLILMQTFHTEEEFGKACNMLSEYGIRQTNPQARYAYCKEHYHCIVAQTALQRLYLF